MNSLFLMILSFLFILTGCGGGGDSSKASGNEDIIVTSQDDAGLSLTANFESLEGEASWTLEFLDANSQSLGMCEFETRAKTDNTPVYFKNKSGDPICSSIEIDPSSTVDNLRILNDFEHIRYCLVDNGNKTCEEVRK